MTRGFSGYHPIINFLWFVEVIAFTMFFMNPVCLAVSLAGSLCYYLKLRGAAALTIAALMAQGESELLGLEHLTRGYCNFAGKLQGLGASISEIECEP